MERYKVTQQFIDDLNKWEYKTSWNFEDAFNFATMPQSVIDYWYYDNEFHLERFIDVLQYLEHTAQQGNNTSNPFMVIPEEPDDNEDNAENSLNDFKVNQYLPDMNDIEYKLDKLKEQVNALSPNRETPTKHPEQDFPAEEYIPAIRELQETVNHLQETLPKLNTQLYEFIQDATD